MQPYSVHKVVKFAITTTVWSAGPTDVLPAAEHKSPSAERQKPVDEQVRERFDLLAWTCLDL